MSPDGSLPSGGTLLAQERQKQRLILTDPGGAGLFIPETALPLPPQQLMGPPSALYIPAEAGYRLPAPAPARVLSLWTSWLRLEPPLSQPG